MEVKELIDTLRVCADDDIICPACPRNEKYKYAGTAECYEKLMLEAAETIESQRKRIAELEAALREQEERRWIPVAERLPQNYISVLVYLQRESPLPTVHEAYIGGDGEWHSSVVYGVENEDVTHWMPMPEPPKEDA